MKQVTWDGLNALAVRIHDLPEGSEALRLALDEELFTGLFALLDYDLERAADGGRPLSAFQEQRMAALAAFWEKDWSAGKFDPERGTFAQFFGMKTGFRGVDDFHKDTGGRRNRRKPSQAQGEGDEAKPGWDYDASLDASVDPEGKDSLLDRQSDLQGDPFVRHAEEAALREYMALALTIPDRLHGRSNTETRRTFYRLFFTDGLSAALRNAGNEGALPPYQERERELLEASETEFLDFFLTAVCRTVPELAEGRLKPYGEMVPGRPMQELEPAGKSLWHLPADVYMTYWGGRRGETLSDSTVSTYWTDYRALCGTLLREARNE